MAQAVIWTSAFRVPDWLPNDTEESVLGTEWHQEAIGGTADLFREASRRRGASWGVCETIGLRGLQYEDGHPYDPRPDVMVLAQPLPSGDLSTVHVDEVGAPLFIVEVASDSTVGNDIGEKRRAYAAIGVQEYLVFDPNGNLLSPPILAWRLVGGVYVPWKPGPDGWWQSTSLDLAFRDRQPFLDIRDRDGQRIELSHEVRQRLLQTEQRADQAERRAGELEQLAGELEQRLHQADQLLAALEEELRRLRAQRSQDS